MLRHRMGARYSTPGLILAVLVLLTLGACSDEEDDSPAAASASASASATASAAGNASAAAAGGVIGGTSAAANHTLMIELREWVIDVNAGDVPAGNIEVSATNTGTVPHEVVILRTDLAADAIPVAEGIADEEAPGVEFVGELEEFAAGGDLAGVFALPAGNYVLVCNVAGHYQLGMHSPLTVE